LLLKSKGIITQLQKNILTHFSAIKDSNNFYLTGGTALAEFYFGHRKSFDIDLFTSQKELIIPFSYVFEEKMSEIFTVKIIRRFETFVEFEVGKSTETVKVQFAYDSPFRIKQPVDSDIGVKVNNYEDIITDKLLTFFGRSEPRDAIDLFFILQKENFEQLIDFAYKKDTGFDLYWFAIALEKVKKFPDDLKQWPVEMIREVDIKKLKNTFENLTLKIMQKIKQHSRKNKDYLLFR